MDARKNKKNTRSSEETKKLKEELENHKKQYLRALADYQNLEKRISDDKDETAKQATKRIILKLLPFIDNLEKAEVFVKDPGLAMIKNQFNKTLKDEGVEELEVLGKRFDPQQAEVIEVVEGNEDNMVTEVLQKGFSLLGKVIRPAQVKVSKKKN